MQRGRTLARPAVHTTKSSNSVHHSDFSDSSGLFFSPLTLVGGSITVGVVLVLRRSWCDNGGHQ